MRRRAEIAQASAHNVLSVMQAALAAARESVATAEALRIPAAERAAILAAAREHLARTEAAQRAVAEMLDSAAATRAVTERSEISRFGVPTLT